MRRLFLLMFLATFSALGYAQNFTISGSIQDAANGEGLIGATVYDKATTSGVSANIYGFYSLTLPAGTYELVYSFVGFRPLVKQIVLDKNIRMDVEMEANSEVLQEVVITGEATNQN
ncbi:carboxypeptidase-like regulatory domain-containing protein, partial [Salibacteraceae bacterium]|nr:carboxypeptidase-like regulatory domain-containing protein [Salibacteraceae bacterium]